MKTMARLACFLGAFTWVFIGCGSLDKKEKSADPDEGLIFSQPVTAASGGTLSTASGGAALQVPAGALAQDTTLTVEVVMADADTASSVYNYGPDGTTFLKAVTLTLRYGGDAPSDKTPVLGTYTGGKWVEVTGSSFSGGVVSGPITHFSKFSIILVGKDIIAVSGCSDVASKFKACGGSVGGSYQITDVCFSDTVLGQNPLAASCPTASLDVEITWDGTVVFTASTVTMNITSQTNTITINVPNTCLTDFGKTCAEVGTSIDMTSCTNSGSVCSCTQTQTGTNPEAPTPMPYQVAGSNLVLGDGTLPYCVAGNKLTLEMSDTDTGTLQKLYLVLTKK